MRDLDELLDTDGTHWRAEQPAPPDLRRAAEEAVAGTRRRSRHARAGLLSSVAAVILLGLGAVLFVVFRTPSTAPVAGAPTSVTVHGTRLPYVGQVPWVNAIADAANPSVVYVYADNDAVGGDTCYAQADRGVARQSGQTVTVTVAGYGIQIGSEGVCPGLAHLPAPVRVELPSPLRGHTLVDGSGTAHPVLDPTTVPDVTRLPGCLHRKIQWDQSTGAVQRSYFDGTGTFASQCAMLSYARTPDNVPPGRPSRPMEVNGRVAQVWDYQHNQMFTLQWTWPTGKHVELTVYAREDQPLSRGYVRAIARSVR